MTVGPSTCRQSPYPDRSLHPPPQHWALLSEAFDSPSCGMQASTAGRQFWRRSLLALSWGLWAS